MAKYDPKLDEEELKLHVAEDWFPAFNCKRRADRIDFCVAIRATELGLYGEEPVMWAEAKAGVRKDIHESFVQLILTIGRARVFDKEQPPRFLGAFDAEKIAFLPYDSVMDVFAQNDFNWNVTPSNHGTKEFAQLYGLAEKTIAENSLLFNYESDEAELRKFIKANFVSGRKDVSRIQITRNNFTHIYQKWRRAVLPSLDVENWDALRKDGIIDADFFLADILSDKDNRTIRKKLYVLLQSDIYEVKYGKASNGLDLVSRIGFKDGQGAHKQFWNHYTRPPRKDYWDFIVERRDLLVDQDVRERKGAFFTPQPWVELSQEYLARELGENWQDEYVIWDCCAGTGNMESGLTNKDNIWASTLDNADVAAMHTRIKMMNERGGANLWDSHVFQFDFLNDSFEKLPKELKAIIDDPEKRKKLVIYINPPYAEAGNAKQRSGTGENKTSVAVLHSTYRRFLDEIGIAGRELFAQFFARIYKDIPGCILGEFSKLKHLQSPNFRAFRQLFKARICRSFAVPSDTFDNVDGDFPIGFFIWNLAEPELFRETVCDIYSAKGVPICRKTILSCDEEKSINDWMIETRKRGGERIAFLSARSHDVQHIRDIYFKNDKAQIKTPRGTWITKRNIIEASVYVAVCHGVEVNWLNDRDQFLYPNDGWKKDVEFHGDCLVFTLFAEANNILSSYGVNHWIPFTEEEVGSCDCFESRFMSDLLAGRLKPEDGDLFEDDAIAKVEISPEARAVLDAGRELWRYYHAQPEANTNASFYDIRKHFQGVTVDGNGKEKMNATSADERYNELREALKTAMRKLAVQIDPKVYEYGFLKR